MDLVATVLLRSLVLYELSVRLIDSPFEALLISSADYRQPLAQPSKRYSFDEGEGLWEHQYLASVMLQM